MNHPNFHWIAEQYHSGKAPDEMDLGSANLSQADRLHLLHQALREFPTEESLWKGSNEVVLPARKAPDNLQQDSANSIARFEDGTDIYPGHQSCTAIKVAPEGPLEAQDRDAATETTAIPRPGMA
jgi:hypothetical protein